MATLWFWEIEEDLENDNWPFWWSNNVSQSCDYSDEEEIDLGAAVRREAQVRLHIDLYLKGGGNRITE